MGTTAHLRPNRRSLVFFVLFFSVALASTLALDSSLALASSARDIAVELDDFPLNLKTEPVIIDGRVLVPLREIGDALGVQSEWCPQTRNVVATGYGRKVVITVGSTRGMIDGRTMKLDVPPTLIFDRTYVPVRLFSEAFGGSVTWNPMTKTVSIVSPPKRLYCLAFYAIRSFDERHLIPMFDAVAFGWSRISKDGHVTLDGIDFRWPEPAGEITGERIIRDASSQAVHPYLVLFADEYSENLTDLLEQEDVADTIASEAMSIVEEKGFEGLVIDFERLGYDADPETLENTRRSFTDFLWKMREKLRTKGKTLVVAIHPPNTHFKGYDLRSIRQVADLVILMSYDYESRDGPEPLDKVNEGILESLKEIPSDRLLLGISSWSENDESVLGKVGLSKRYGLKGISVWRLGLIRRVFQGLQSTGVLRELPAATTPPAPKSVG